MPNWCENRVELSGSDLKALRGLIGTDDQAISFQRIKPMPEDLGKVVAGSAEDGYEVLYGDADKILGYKWVQDAVGPQDIKILADEDDYLRLWFHTAWSPPQGVYEALLELIDDNGLDIQVTWFYDEQGMQFAGYLSAA